MRASQKYKRRITQNEPEILAALMKKIKIYNYIPKGVEAEYARALLEEYKNSITKSNTKKLE